MFNYRDIAVSSYYPYLSERLNAPYIIIIGSDEVENGVFKLKNTVLKTEEMKKIEELNEIFNIEGEKYAYKK